MSAATWTVPHAPILDEWGEPFYDYGTRVDCYAWGENVTTLTDPGYVMHGFAGTSAAVPVIAGAAAILQGIAKANGQLLQVQRSCAPF